jgi:hypothetical protein
MDVAARPDGYESAWYVFDNMSGVSTPIGVARGVTPLLGAPAELPSAEGALVRVDVSTVGSNVEWSTPVRLYFRRDVTSWRLVALDRRIPGASAN